MSTKVVKYKRPTKAEYIQIMKAAEELFVRVMDRKPKVSEWDSATRTYSRFVRSTYKWGYEGYPYILIVPKLVPRPMSEDPFYNENMVDKFGKTHLRKKVAGVTVIAGYLALGTGGVGIVRLQRKWTTWTIE